MKHLAWVLALFLAACAAMAPQPPSVALAGIGIESLGLFEQRFVLKLRVKNPNNVDIPVEGIDFDVELNGRHFANGVSNVGVTIPRLGEVVLDVKASSNLAVFLHQWKELEKGGRSALDYRVKGKLQIGGHGVVPFDHRGEAPLPKLPGGPAKPSSGAV